MNTSNLKEYIKSSVITFIAMFAVSVLNDYNSVQWTRDGLFALGATGVRAGVKGILEILAVIKPTTSVKPLEKQVEIMTLVPKLKLKKKK